jgi:two-component system invasion response regulator UvrY
MGNGCSYGAARPITTMLVDDHAIVRAGFRRLLEQEADIQIVAEAGSGDRAYALYELHTPDVVVLDLSMRGVGGFELIARIIGRDPAATILVFSMHEDPSFVERAIRLGARGYVTKSNAPEVLATAIGEVAAGQIFLSADVARSIARLKLTGIHNPVQALSASELELLRLLVAGRPEADIATTLRVSAKTVTDGRSLLKRKLRIGDDMELLLLALGRHLV